MKSKYKIGYSKLLFYDTETEQPLLVVEDPDIEFKENEIVFKDNTVGEIIKNELKIKY